MTSAARDQVPRMLALVPYLRSHEGIPVEQVAADFGVGTAQIVKDLNVLWFCGLPGAVTGEMIDIDMDALEGEGVVFIDNAGFLPRPLRLSMSEALSLIVALRTLRETATSAELPTIESALAKLESAAGDGAAASAAVQVHIERADPQVHEAIAGALAGGRQLHIDYVVPSRDEQTERTVDPLRLLTAEGRPYLEAWCHRVEDIRLFRLDRITTARVADVAADRHDDVRRRDLSAGLFQPGPDDVVAVVDLDPPARWIAEYYPVESSDEGPDGALQVRMRVADTSWLRRLVLRQGGAARVVAPAEVARDVRRTALDALANYRSHIETD
ncbi:MAG: WYL domain-containing protein [Nocardioidaceae bacterium]|nr:WYL domain-containing protein [Nocardioidaceae bacterium]